MRTIKIQAGTSSSGEPVFEEIAVEPTEDSWLRVLRTPGLVLGIARDDQISYDSQSFALRLERRGGRVGVQLYFASAGSDEIANLAAALERVVSATWDGLSDKQAVFSFPARAGFAEAELLLNQFKDSHPGSDWFYCNVYDDDGVTALNWWVDL